MEQQIESTERVHRAQTNAAIAIGSLISMKPLRIVQPKPGSGMVNDETGEFIPAQPFATLTFVLKTSDTQFLNCEATGPLAYAALGMKRGSKYLVSGRFEIRTNPTGEGDEAFTYQNETLRLVDRTIDRETGNPKENAIPPLLAVDPETPTEVKIRFVGTVGPKAFQTVQAGQGMKVRGSVACNGTKKDRTTWFDVESWSQSKQAELLSIPRSALIDVQGTVKSYRVQTPKGTQAVRWTVSAEAVSVIASKIALTTPATLTAQSAATAANILAMLGAPRQQTAAVNTAIDAADTLGAGDYEGQDHTDALLDEFAQHGAHDASTFDDSNDEIGVPVATKRAARSRRKKAA